ncbi:MAG TPA: hypothetical protein VHI13_08880 [Candidatus Kapabacteria bacterium]|nr:hypothetical protein [Candidatus Kapabacteria bacterium]
MADYRKPLILALLLASVLPAAVIRAPHANRVAKGTASLSGANITLTLGTFPANVAPAQIVLYISLSGTVSTSGTTATWVAGTTFDTLGNWTGRPVQIGGVFYTVDHVVDSTHFVTTSTIPTSPSATFSIAYNPIPTLLSTSSGTAGILNTQFPITAGVSWEIYDWSPGQYEQGTEWYETDRQVRYQLIGGAGTATVNGQLVTSPTGLIDISWVGKNLQLQYARSGTVSTNGTAVTWTTGSHFNASWQGQTVLLGGSPYQVAYVQDANHLQVTTSAGVGSGTTLSGTFWEGYRILSIGGSTIALTAPATNGAGVPYRFSSGGWEFLSGRMVSTYGALPTDLGGDDAGFVFAAQDVEHVWRWLGAGWTWDMSDPYKDNRFVALMLQAPAGTAWVPCNGSIQTFYQADATTTTIHTPNLTQTGAGDNIMLQAGPYTGPSQTAALGLHWAVGAHTDSAATGLDSTNITNSAPSATVVVQSGTGTTVASDTHSHTVTVSDPTHSHGLSDTNAPQQAPGETNGGLPVRMSFQTYMHR